MSGGLFGKPFAVNEKCIIFSILVISLFLARPELKSIWAKVLVTGGLFIVAYVGMAWYDYFYNCSDMPLERGGGPTSAFKPPVHAGDKQKIGGRRHDRPIEHRRRRLLIYAAHVALIAPLLGYVAYKGKKAPPETWTILGTVAVLTAGYHGARLLQVW